MIHIFSNNSVIKVFIFLMLFLMFLVSSNATGKNLSKKKSVIIPENILANWGYKTKKTGTENATTHLQKKFGFVKIFFHKIKAVEMVPGWKGAYYRFTLRKEVYKNSKDSGARLKNLFYKPPGLNTKMEPESVLKKGFIKDYEGFIVSTDVRKFYI